MPKLPQVQDTSARTHGSATEPKASTQEAEHKQASWVSISTGSSLAHVGSIYFSTKESLLDEGDRALLGELASAYVRHAASIGGHADGLSGRIVGYADPRPSHEPDNEELSASRAATVWHELAHAFDERSLATGYYPFQRKAGGVAPGVGGSFAAARRADIYIQGYASSNAAAPLPKAAVPAKPVEPEVQTTKAPDHSGEYYQLDDFRYQIERGHERTINGVATRIKVFYEWGTMADLVEQIKHLKIPAEQPPWWNSLAVERQMFPRGTPTTDEEVRKQVLIDKALLLLRHSREAGFYVPEAEAAFHKYYAEQSPGHWEILRSEQSRPLAYMSFMIDALIEEAREVQRLSD